MTTIIPEPPDLVGRVDFMAGIMARAFELENQPVPPELGVRPTSEASKFAAAAAASRCPPRQRLRVLPGGGEASAGRANLEVVR